MSTQIFGYVGLVAFAFAWIPQTWQTVRQGRCDLNAVFLGLSALGSVALTTYAVLRGDTVFAVLNAMTTVGALINIWYRAYPRPAAR